MAHLLGLADEILNLIIQELKFPDFVSVAQCCKKLDSVAKTHKDRVNEMYSSMEIATENERYGDRAISRFFEMLVEAGIGPLVRELRIHVCDYFDDMDYFMDDYDASEGNEDVDIRGCIKDQKKLRQIIRVSTSRGMPNVISPFMKHMCYVLPFLTPKILEIVKGTIRIEPWPTLKLIFPLLRNLRSLTIPQRFLAEDFGAFGEYVASVLQTSPPPVVSNSSFLESSMSVPFSSLEELNFYTGDYVAKCDHNLLGRCAPFMRLPSICAIGMENVEEIDWDPRPRV